MLIGYTKVGVFGAELSTYPETGTRLVITSEVTAVEMGLMFSRVTGMKWGG